MAEAERPAIADRELRQGPLGRDLFMVFLAIVSIAILIWDEVADLPPEQRLGLIVIDTMIVIVFALEFLLGLWQAENKKAYWKSHWWELPGLMPMALGEIGFLRVARLARVARILRIVRVVSILSRIRRVNRVAKGFIARSHITTLIAVSATLILAASYLEFLFESEAGNPQFATFWDALWWGLVTVTTVGYGDKFPISFGGKIVATFLMFTGIGTIGLLAGSLANAFLRGSGDSSGSDAGVRVEERLAKLSALHTEGKLTDEEFRAAKAVVLEGK